MSIAHIVFLFVTVIWYPSGPATTVQPMKTQASCLELKKFWDFDQQQDNAVESSDLHVLVFEGVGRR